MALCSGYKRINKMQRKVAFGVFLFNVYMRRKRNAISFIFVISYILKKVLKSLKLSLEHIKGYVSFIIRI